jgi:hypothetical protein
MDRGGLVGGALDRSDGRGDFPAAEMDQVEEWYAERESSIADHLYALSSQPPLTS